MLEAFVAGGRTLRGMSCKSNAEHDNARADAWFGEAGSGKK
jgi:hypothetical protein